VLGLTLSFLVWNPTTLRGVRNHASAVLHAGVNEVTVRLWTDADTLWLVVADQGRGFDPQRIDRHASSGLAGMQERAALLGGSLTIEAGSGGGTRLTAILPLHSGAGSREQEQGP
jgi:signal transduction histidine kinase